MTKKSLHFWILFVASLFLATLVISFALKIVKAVLLLLLLLVLTPIIYAILKSLLDSGKLAGRSEKLKRRD
jgi:VanZ family protein